MPRSREWPRQLRHSARTVRVRPHRKRGVPSAVKSNGDPRPATRFVIGARHQIATRGARISANMLRKRPSSSWVRVPLPADAVHPAPETARRSTTGCSRSAVTAWIHSCATRYAASIPALVLAAAASVASLRSSSTAARRSRRLCFAPWAHGAREQRVARASRRLQACCDAFSASDQSRSVAVRSAIACAGWPSSLARARSMSCKVTGPTPGGGVRRAASTSEKSSWRGLRQDNCHTAWQWWSGWSRVVAVRGPAQWPTYLSRQRSLAP